MFKDNNHQCWIWPNVQRHQSIYVFGPHATDFPRLFDGIFPPKGTPEVSGGNGTPKISSGNRSVGEIDVCIFVY